MTFKILFLFFCNFLKASVQLELNNFFKIINKSDVPIQFVSSGAFTKARKKLNYTIFTEMNDVSIEHFYENNKYNTWNGFRLIACDGSIINLPFHKKLAIEFGVKENQHTKYIQARISEAYDVLNQISIDAHLDKYSVSEQKILVNHHLKKLQSDQLWLYDRNYPSTWLIAYHVSKNSNFCMRIQSNTWIKQQRKLKESPNNELITEITVRNDKRNKHEELNLPITPIKVRFIKVELDSGEIEVLVTSLLDTKKYPAEIFKKLYALRWGVEENYKIQKHKIEIENFTGLSTLAIKQDFYAKIFMMNLGFILSFNTKEEIDNKTKSRKHKYQINQIKLMGSLKNCGFLIFIRKNYKSIIIKILDVVAQNIEAIRPGRKFKRKRVFPKRFPIGYKPIS